MQEFFKAALQAVPLAATSPLSLIAFVVVIAAWVIIAFRVTRIKLVLSHLKDIPENQRMDAIRAEMGSIIPPDLKSDPTPFLRLKTHFYFFTGFSFICVVLVVVFLTAALTHSSNLLLFFLSFALLCLILVLIFARNAFRINSDLSSNASISLYHSRSNSKPYPHTANTSENDEKKYFVNSKGDNYANDDNEYDSDAGNLPYAPFEVEYIHSLDNKRLQINYQSSYLSLLAKGGPIEGASYYWSPFRWEFPKLSIKVVNNSTRTLFLSEALIKVNSSKINLEPVLLIKEDFYNVGHFLLLNEGWGQVIDPIIKFRITNAYMRPHEFVNDYYWLEPQAVFFKASTLRRESPYGSEMLNLYRYKSEEKEEAERLLRFTDNIIESKEHIVHMGTFSESLDVPILEAVPEDLKGQACVCIFGTIEYDTEGKKHHTIKFETRVSLAHPGPGIPRPPTYLYELFLEAGKFGYTKTLSIYQEIKPKEVDHFLIRVSSNKSALFDMDFSFLATDKTEIPSDKVILDMFVPRTQLVYVSTRKTKTHARQKQA